MMKLGSGSRYEDDEIMGSCDLTKSCCLDFTGAGSLLPCNAMMCIDEDDSLPLRVYGVSGFSVSVLLEAQLTKK